ncbi:MAG: hypothetical protein IJ661_10685 [Lachnospiraceae bacterium]|nr:hypothetical protein [Lachnospiraceae bacterium]
MSTKINTSYNPAYTIGGYLKGNTSSNIIPGATGAAMKHDTTAVVAISAEGKRNYLNNGLNKSDSIESIMERRKALQDGGEAFDTDYAFVLGNKLASIKGEKAKNATEETDWYASLEEESNDLLRAYAEIYDDIIKKHENALNEKSSVKDNDNKDMSVDEEIGLLNAECKAHADFLEIQAEMTPKIIAVMEEYIKRLPKKYADTSETVTNAKKFYLDSKDKAVPDKLSEKVISATQLFIKQYSNQRNTGIDNILKNINVFKV